MKLKDIHIIDEDSFLSRAIDLIHAKSIVNENETDPPYELGTWSKRLEHLYDIMVVYIHESEDLMNTFETLMNGAEKSILTIIYVEWVDAYIVFPGTPEQIWEQLCEAMPDLRLRVLVEKV